MKNLFSGGWFALLVLVALMLFVSDAKAEHYRKCNTGGNVPVLLPQVSSGGYSYSQTTFNSFSAPSIDYNALQAARLAAAQQAAYNDFQLRQAAKQAALRQAQLNAYANQFNGFNQYSSGGFGGGFRGNGRFRDIGGGGGGNAANFFNTVLDPQFLGGVGGAAAGVSLAGPGAGVAGAAIGSAVGQFIGRGLNIGR